MFSGPALLMFACCTAAKAAAAAPYQVFTSGERVAPPNNTTVGCFRIPSVARTPEGTLLAFAEGRLNGCRPDFMAGRPIVVRASTDNGRSWGPVRVAAAGNSSYGLSYPAATRLRDRVLLLFSLGTVSPGQRSDGVYATYSSDQGLTWTDPKLTNLPIGCAESAAALLPGGRLVAACTTFASFSDDDGLTWRRGAGNASWGANVTGGGESYLVSDGRAGGLGLSMLVRMSSGSGMQNHAIGQSDDAGQTWGPIRLLDMPGTTCQASVAHLPGSAPGELWLASPHFPEGGLGGRRNITVFKLDGSEPGSQPVPSVLVWGGMGGYSAWETSGPSPLLVFEAGVHSYNYGIKVSEV